MNLKKTKAEFIQDILKIPVYIPRLAYYNPEHDIEDKVRKIIDDAIYSYSESLCAQIARVMERNIYSAEEQEKDLGIR